MKKTESQINAEVVNSDTPEGFDYKASKKKHDAIVRSINKCEPLIGVIDYLEALLAKIKDISLKDTYLVVGEEKVNALELATEEELRDILIRQVNIKIAATGAVLDSELKSVEKV